MLFPRGPIFFAFAVASLGSVVSAQVVKFYPCYTAASDGSLIPDPSRCQNGMACTQDPLSPRYYCGLRNSPCTDASQCQVGECRDNRCSGGYGDACPAQGAVCAAARLFCGADLTCGGSEAFCPYNAFGVTYLNRGVLCTSGTCNLGNLRCTAPPPPVVLPVPSGQARARRNQILGFEKCSSGHKGCPLNGGSSFECIDIRNNLERCGGCGSGMDSGVDCTEITNAESVLCEEGTCVITSCVEGTYYDARQEKCLAESRFD